jgi:protein-L-isoaspartate O-methyltransferase
MRVSHLKKRVKKKPDIPREIFDSNTFQLIGPNGELSKKFNLRSSSNKRLTNTTNIGIKEGLVNSNYKNIGFKKHVLNYPEFHNVLINYLNKNPKIKKKVLVIGPAKGYELKNISKRVENLKIDAFDVIDEIDKKYRGYLQGNGLYINKGGIENYTNNKLIGKYDGINAIMSAGYHTIFPERNLIKIAMMLKPKGMAVVTLNGNRVYNSTLEKRFLTRLHNMFKRLKLDNLYNISFADWRVIIITRN